MFPIVYRFPRVQEQMPPLGLKRAGISFDVDYAVDVRLDDSLKGEGFQGRSLLVHLRLGHHFHAQQVFGML